MLLSYVILMHLTSEFGSNKHSHEVNCSKMSHLIFRLISTFDLMGDVTFKKM